MAGLLRAAGWTVSLLKHKLGIPVDMIRVLGGLSAGLARKGD